MNDVLKFCLNTYREDLNDCFEILEIESNRIQCHWSSKDMLMEPFAQGLGFRRWFWRDIQEGFPHHDLEVHASPKGWTIMVSLSKPDSLPNQVCHGHEYMQLAKEVDLKCILSKTTSRVFVLDPNLEKEESLCKTVSD